MKSDVLVSVIIPTFNSEKYILSTIESVINQTYKNFEIIIIDDGSTDNTVNIVNNANIPLLSLIAQKNQGSAVARNKGIMEAKGEYIAFLDADDYWFPHKLAEQITYMEEHQDVGLVYNNWYVWVDSDKSVPPNEELVLAGIDDDFSGWLYAKLLFDSCVHTSAALVRRKIIEKTGMFDIDLRKGQDYDYWIRISRLTKISKLNSVLSVYRIRNDSISFEVREENYPYKVITKALNKWGRKCPEGGTVAWSAINRRLAKLLLVHAYNHYLYGDRNIAKKNLIKSISTYPLLAGEWFLLFRLYIL